jgi:hypothetical protein
MSYTVTESGGLRITRVTRGDVKDYWLCQSLGSGVEEKHKNWAEVLEFIQRYEKGERA